MHRAFIFAAAIGLAATQAQANDELAPLPPQLRHCIPPAVHRPDNDVQTDLEAKRSGTKIALPSAVATSIDTATGWVTRPERYADQFEKDQAAVRAELAAWRCRDIYPLANSVDLPDGRRLFAVHARSFAVAWLLLIVYDPVSGKATPKPAYVNLKWTSPGDDLLKRPFIATADLRGDGHIQIVFEERAHNGTVYNGAVYRYFDIGPDLSLTNVLALETRVLDPLLSSDGMLMRTLTRIDATHQRIDQIYVAGKRRIAGGYAILESADPNTPFHVVERHASKKRASPHFELGDDTLITLSEEADDTFLKEGHGLYY